MKKFQALLFILLILAALVTGGPSLNEGTLEVTNLPARVLK